jgi:hypothetical protein
VINEPSRSLNPLRNHLKRQVSLQVSAPEGECVI